jgi:hypothetical protein
MSLHEIQLTRLENEERECKRALQNAAGRDAREAAHAECQRVGRALYLFKEERAKEAAAAERASKLAALRAEAATGVQRARESKRLAEAGLAALRAERDQVQARVDATRQRAEAARADHERAKQAHIDLLVEGHDPDPLPALPDYPSAIRRLEAPLATLDQQVATAEQAIRDANKSIPLAIANEAIAKIYELAPALKQHVLTAIAALHRSGTSAPEWGKFLSLACGDSGWRLWISDPTLADPDALQEQFDSAFAAASAEKPG